MVLMKEEYEALRAEMLAWQNRRFIVVTASISLVVGILGLEGVTEATSRVDWELVSSLLIFLLGSAEALTWYGGQAPAKIAAYIIVYHEAQAPGWETRLKNLKGERLDRFSLNRMLTLIYAGLGILSLLIPWAARKEPIFDFVHLWHLVPTFCWFVFGLYLLVLPLPRERFEHLWNKMKSQPSDESSGT